MSTVGVVTGGGRGVGLACAQRLARTVDSLLLVDSDDESVKAAAQELDGAEALVLDVTEADDTERLAARVRELGTLRSLVHAAAVPPFGADWRRVLAVNLRGTALVAEAVRPLATDDTAFVCLASTAPLLGITGSEPAAVRVLDQPLAPDLADRLLDVVGVSVEDSGNAYAWAKLGVQRFVRHEAVRLGAAGARICSVSPGFIDTPQGRAEADARPVVNALVRQSPLARMGKPEEVAAVVAFVLSGDASFVNGVDLVVDGGVWAAQQR